VGRMA